MEFGHGFSYTTYPGSAGPEASALGPDPDPAASAEPETADA
jgi:hypothetical protein